MAYFLCIIYSCRGAYKFDLLYFTSAIITSVFVKKCQTYNRHRKIIAIYSRRDKSDGDRHIVEIE